MAGLCELIRNKRILTSLHFLVCREICCHSSNVLCVSVRMAKLSTFNNIDFKHSYKDNIWFRAVTLLPNTLVFSVELRVCIVSSNCSAVKTFGICDDGFLGIFVCRHLVKNLRFA